MKLDELRSTPVPGEAEARHRAREVAHAALAQRPPRRRRLASVLAPTATALVAAFVAFTPPGDAVAEWVRDVVTPAPQPARPAGANLPGGGQLLLVAPDGPTVVGNGKRDRLLGQVDEATWSPHGLHVAAVRGPELIAVTRGGERRWSLARPGIRFPRWSPSGFRVAFLSGGPGQGGRVLRVVAGDGSGERPLASSRPVAPAWRPRHPEQLAYVDPAGRVVLRDADTGRVMWRRRAGDHVTQLAWSPDGSTLLALAPRSLTHFGAGIVRESFAGPGERHVAAAFTAKRRFALIVQTRRGSRVSLTTPRGTRTLLTLAAAISDVAWSPNRRWLALARGSTTLLLDTRTRDLRTVGGGWLAGWCCER